MIEFVEWFSMEIERVLPASIVAIALFINCLMLFRRWRRWRQEMILSAIIPRLYLALAYTYFAIGEISGEPVSNLTRATTIRAGVMALAVTEVISHIVSWRSERIAKRRALKKYGGITSDGK